MIVTPEEKKEQLLLGVLRDVADLQGRNEQQGRRSHLNLDRLPENLHEMLLSLCTNPDKENRLIDYERIEVNRTVVQIPSGGLAFVGSNPQPFVYGLTDSGRKRLRALEQKYSRSNPNPPVVPVPVAIPVDLGSDLRQRNCEEDIPEERPKAVENKINNNFAFGKEQQSETDTKKTMFLSYNWAQTEQADKIESQISNYIDVIRDKNIIGDWASLTEFMKRIRREDFAALLISDEYLKAISCMFEISELVKDENWHERVMCYVCENARSIYNPLGQPEYIKYWENYRCELDKRINETPKQSQAGLIGEYNKVCAIQNCVGFFLSKVKDLHNPSDIDGFIEAVKTKIGVHQSGILHKDQIGSQNLFETSSTIEQLCADAISALVSVLHTDYNQIILSAQLNSHANGLIVCADSIAKNKPRYRIVHQSGLIAESFRSSEVINIGDVSTCKSYFRAVNETASELCVPIIFNGQTLGVINSESTHKNHYTSEKVGGVIEISEHFAHKIVGLGYSISILEKDLPPLKKFHPIGDIY